MLDIARIANSPATSDPFEYFIAHDVLSADCADALVNDCPVLHTNGSYPVATLKFGPTFKALLDEIRRRPFADAIGAHFGLPDLATLPQLITYRGWSSAKDGSVHTDSESKLITVLLYLNPSWEQPGGRLRLLRSNNLEDVAAEVPPTCGTLVAFRRSDRSFHGHKPCSGERRLLQINWVSNASYVDREERRHRRSARLKSLLGFGSH
jgi:SM-20-related protein